jgi:hypothetical protein
MFEEIENPAGVIEIFFTDSDGKIWYIPQVEGNSDYQAFLASKTVEEIPL